MFLATFSPQSAKAKCHYPSIVKLVKPFVSSGCVNANYSFKFTGTPQDDSRVGMTLVSGIKSRLQDFELCFKDYKMVRSNQFG